MAEGPIVLVGGYMGSALSTRRLARILREVSESEVFEVPMSPLDWALGRVRGYGQLVFEIASTVDRALLGSDAERAVIVGFSSGGILARVYLGGDPPYGGRRHSGHRRVSHLITLGTPHNSTGKGPPAAVAEVNDLFPGTLHENIRYLSVAGDAVDGVASLGARRHYERFVDDGRVKGDGLVPVPAALLPGAEHLVLDGVYHNRVRGGPRGRWYGTDRETVERWWPKELARAGASPESEG